MIFTVWGASGAGKTAVSVQLANALAKKGLFVGLISSSLEYSELPALMNQWVYPKHGLYMALQDGNARDHFWKCPISPNIFILTAPTGYAGYDWEDISQDAAETLLEQAASHFDIVLVDGHELLSNPISSVSLVKSQGIITLHRPSPKAEAWHLSREDTRKHLKLDVRTVHIENTRGENADTSAYWHGISLKPWLTVPFIEGADLSFKPQTGKAAKDIDKFLSSLMGWMDSKGKEVRPNG
ncbi:MAG: hypothetical protein LBR85_09075 [Oscillospiraceae bacterium]|jgi:molybdopterin-guanine dinucleotide biosynthesis protein|nr:hypothetical protein [Oscillospiraceae bacterium]